MHFREQATREIEESARASCRTGECERFFSEADSLLRVATTTVNGPGFQRLASATDFVDPSCVEMFRHGADFLGKLPSTGLGVACEFDAHLSIDQLRSTCGERNSRLLAALAEDKHSKELLSATIEDCQFGRMTEPVGTETLDLEQLNLAVRFGVEQGYRDDGTLKVRPVDDESANGTNGLACC